MKEIYYVYKADDGTLGRIAKRTSNGIYYGWEKGKWIEMPNLIKIELEITNYEKITKEEAERLIKKKSK